MPDDPATVLLLDDDGDMLSALARQVRLHGYTVRTFTRAGQVLDYLRTAAADCLVADLEMPAMTGLALQEVLAAEDHWLSIVFLTGRGDVQSAVQALQAGAVDFLQKPVEAETLMSAIARGVDAARIRSRENAARREALSKFEQLTERQRAVLKAVVAGKPNKKTAHELDITERTVKAHRQQIMEKLGVHSVAELVRFVDGLPDHGDDDGSG